MCQVEATYPQLTAEEARKLTDEIKSDLISAKTRIIEAIHGQAWIALGYESWETYSEAEFTDARMIRWSRTERKGLFTALSQQGLSQRQIGASTGFDHKTVGSDLREGGENSPPAPTTQDPEREICHCSNLGIYNSNWERQPHYKDQHEENYKANRIKYLKAHPEENEIVDAEVIEDEDVSTSPNLAELHREQKRQSEAATQKDFSYSTWAAYCSELWEIINNAVETIADYHTGHAPEFLWSNPDALSYIANEIEREEEDADSNPYRVALTALYSLVKAQQLLARTRDSGWTS